MNDLVSRLNALSDYLYDEGLALNAELAAEAAEEIKRLEVKCDRLEQEIEDIKMDARNE